MFESVFGRIIAAGMIVVAIFYLVDIVRSFSHDAVVYKGQQLFRSVIFIFMETLLVLWAMGGNYFFDKEIIKTIICFFASLVLGAFIVVFTVMDIRRVTLEFVVRAKELSNRFRNDGNA